MSGIKRALKTVKSRDSKYWTFRKADGSDPQGLVRAKEKNPEKICFFYLSQLEFWSVGTIRFFFSFITPVIFVFLSHF